MKQIILGAICMGVMLISSCEREVKLKENNIDRIIKELTLEEKAGLCIGVGYNWMDGTDDGWSFDRKVPGAAGNTLAIERLGIPEVVLSDGPAGMRILEKRPNIDRYFYCTHFPIGTLLSSSWDSELVENVGKALGEEVLEYGADVLLAPALNIHRNPLNGRDFEYYSEDPVLAVKLEDLASYNEQNSAWEVEEGEYSFRVGASSRDIRSESKVSVSAKSTKANRILQR